MLKVQHKHEFNYSVIPELEKAIENISRFEVMQKCLVLSFILTFILILNLEDFTIII